MPTLNHIALAVSDPIRSAELFIVVFGAESVTHEPGKGPLEVTVRLGDLTLVLVKADGPPILGAAHVAFNAPKSSAMNIRNDLQSLGLRAEAARGGDPDRALYFADFDNNLYEVCLS